MKILDHLRAAAEAQETATPGPWESNGFDFVKANCRAICQVVSKTADIHFIAAAGSIPFAKVLAVVEAAAWWAEVNTVTAPGLTGSGLHEILASIDDAALALTAALAALEAK